MARWADIDKTLGIEVCFCDPQTTWLRAFIEDNANTMPGKLHNWASAQTT